MALSLKQQEVLEYSCLFVLGLVAQLFVESVVDYTIPNDPMRVLIVYSTLFGCAMVLTLAAKMFLLETSDHRQLAQAAETYRKLQSDGFFPENNSNNKHVLQNQQLRWSRR